MRQGNTEELDVTTQTTLRRVTPMQRQKLEFVANYTKVDDDVSKDDQRWTLNSDYFVTGRFFVRLPDAEYLQDAEQNLDYRITLGCGVGYDLIKTHATDWQLTIGPAFQKTAYESVQSGTDQSEESSALLLMSTFDTDLSKRLDLTLEYRGQFTTSEGGSNIHHGVATVEFEIHKRLVLDVSFVWDRIAEPEPDENGVTPEKDDYKIIMSLGVHL
jgi:putative salt-induced outer membrane protein YdiY